MCYINTANPGCRIWQKPPAIFGNQPAIIKCGNFRAGVEETQYGYLSS
jgi:hypothetical protein